MEKNYTFASGQIQRVRAKLTFAQVDVVPTKSTDFALIISGDEESLEGLRIEQVEGELVVAQPQLAYAREIIPRRRWMQICLRVPESWRGAMDIDTVTGIIGAHNIQSADLALTTVSGSMSVREAVGDRLMLHTVSGAISGTELRSERANLRSVSGKITIDGGAFGSTKVFTVSGHVSLRLDEGCRSVDMQSVSGSLSVETDAPARASLHSLSGQFIIAGDVQQADGGLEISASSVSGDLAVSRKK